MTDDRTAHRELLGRSDHELRLISGSATHQHYKGGLYRLVGEVKDADTGQPILGKDGRPRVLYQHCYPYAREYWARDHSEFFGTVLDLSSPDVENRETRPLRFRPLAGAYIPEM